MRQLIFMFASLSLTFFVHAEVNEFSKIIEEVDWAVIFTPYKLSSSSLQEDQSSPFTPLVVEKKERDESSTKDPLVTYDLSQFKLIGILLGSKNPKAMILAPDNKVYTVNKNKRIGIRGGYVSEITKGKIVIIEQISIRGKQTASKQVLQFDENKK